MSVISPERVHELMEAAEEVLKAVEDPSRISSSVLRNMLELADISQDLDEFLLRAGYLVARQLKKLEREVKKRKKGASEKARALRNLYGAIRQKVQGRDIQYVKELLEFVVMKYEVSLRGLP